MNIYSQIYDLLSYYIFGGNIAVGSVAETSCSLVSTALCFFIICIPFVLVWRLIKLLAGC